MKNDNINQVSVLVPKEIKHILSDLEYFDKDVVWLKYKNFDLRIEQNKTTTDNNLNIGVYRHEDDGEHYEIEQIKIREEQWK